MFDETSRYHSVETATLTLPDGRTVAYKRRRIVPRIPESATTVEVAFRDGERLDLFAARTLGDPEQFWRIADANDAVDPAELEAPGRRLRVPPQG